MVSTSCSPDSAVGATELMRVLSAADAAREITAAVAIQPSLRMPLVDANGHVLAEDVMAAVPLPPWTNAGMDGYAVRAEDIRGATASTPIQLQIIDAIAAGATPQAPIGRGEAARIFTGAAVPDGADSVVRQEDTEQSGTTVSVQRDRDAGSNVRRAGADLARGALTFPAGTVLGPHQIAVLAALGVAHPVVHRRPRVGVLTSGDELVPLDRPDEITSGAGLGDANGPALAVLVSQAGAIAVPLGIARDDAAELERTVRSADDVDLLITAGGVSVGDHDHVRSVMQRCGVRQLFDRVRVRPGGPATFGLFPDGRAWLALPGNPVSAMVTFELFGRPAIRAMGGHRVTERRQFQAQLGDDVRRDATLDQYVRCTFEWPVGETAPLARLTGPQGSGMLMSIARADGLAIIPAGDGVLPAGASVTVMTFD